MRVDAGSGRFSELHGGEPLFELRDVEFRADGRRLLGPLSLSLDKGTVIGIIGPNGSGKSTLLRLLAGQSACTGGDIVFEGSPLPLAGSRSLARRLAFLPQSPPPTDMLRVRELVGLGRYAWHGPFGRMGAVDEEAVDRALARTGLDAMADRLVDTLSGGERQRAWLALMIAQEASCLLLDEPTSALDARHQKHMLELVRDLNRSLAHSVLIVLHDLNMAARYCDELLVLSGGRLAARGTPADIVSPDLLETVFGTKMGVVRPRDAEAPIAYVL